MDEDLSVRWSQATPLTIQTDATGDAWNAGAARDVAAVDADHVLVATDTGGLWMAYRNGDALPVGDVERPDFWCIRAGSYGDDHFYAAGAKLYETDISRPLPLLNWREIPVEWPEGGPIGGKFMNSPYNIYRVAVLREDRRIVVATTDGVAWADIPPPPPRPRGCLDLILGAGPGAPPPPPVYTWKKAKGLEDVTLGYLGIAVGAPQRGEIGRSVAVASWGYKNDRDRTFEPLQFYRGEWEGGELVMKKAVMNAAQGIDVSMARATTMTSCDAQPDRMYAISSDDAGFPILFWRSDDGGRSWTPSVPTLVEPADKSFAEAAGNQGNSPGRPCNCIAASRRKADTVAVGWRAGGFFVSEDAGRTWRRTDTENSPHTHADVHAVYFDPTDPEGERVFIAHDGGVSMAPRLGRNAAQFESMYNRQLATLQFQTAPSRMFFGGAAANPSRNGVLIGGLQDNGVATCSVQPAVEPWRQFDSGDGFQTTFLRSGHALYNNNDEELKPLFGVVRHAYWGVSPAGLVQAEYVRVRKDDPQMPIPAGLPQAPGATVVFSTVTEPRWTNREGNALYAVAAKRSSVYGLFYDSSGLNPRWEFLARFALNDHLGEDDIEKKNWEPWAISAVASLDGGTIYLGTNGGRLIVFDQRTRVAREILVPLRNDPWGDPEEAVHKIVVAHDGLAFALYNVRRGRQHGDAYSRFDEGYVLRIRPPRADVLAALPVECFYGLEVAREREQVSVYAATDSNVYVSRDGGDALGDTWARASSGLPKRAHCGDLSYVVQPNDERWLYLSTYGRSYWRAPR